MKTLKRVADFVLAALAATFVAGAVFLSVEVLSGEFSPKFDFWTDLMLAPPIFVLFELPMTGVALAIALALVAVISVFLKNLPQFWALAGVFSAVRLAVIVWGDGYALFGASFDVYAHIWLRGLGWLAIVAGSVIAGGLAAARVWTWATLRGTNA